MINLSLVIPCYNETEVLPETARRLRGVFGDLVAKSKISPSSRIFFIDDGSQDTTWAIISQLASENPMYNGIRLSRNCGHQNALLAGLLTVPGDAVISLDADLQDDLGAIEQMVDAAAQGSEIVYGVRDCRKTDGFLKRCSAEAYYHLLAKLGVDVVFNHADYRLMTRRAITALMQFREANLFLRGIVPLIGLRTSTVTYARAERYAGESKYPLRKMLSLALNGVTSFSVFPLRIIFFTGLVISFISFGLGCYVIVMKILLPEHTVHGWASTVLPIYFLGGIQLLCTGIIGEYVGKAYMETKQRPRYFIDEFAGNLGADPKGR